MVTKNLIFYAKPPYDLQITAQNEIFAGVTSGIDRLSSGKLVKYLTKQVGSTDNPKFEITIASKKKLTDEELVEIRQRLNDYYDFNKDLTDFYKLGKRDKILGLAQRDLKGARLLNGIESFFDCCVIVICSQNTSFKACKRMVDNLKHEFGEQFDKRFAFPIPKVLAQASLGNIRKCGLGYRAKYVKQLAKAFFKGRISVEGLAKLNNEKAKEELMKLNGIGPYSADVILLYGLGRRDAVYSDILVRKSFSQLYFKGKELDDDEVKTFARKKWGKWAGLAEIYIIKDLENLSKKFGLALKWI